MAEHLLDRAVNALERIADALEHRPLVLPRQPNRNRYPFDLERAKELYGGGRTIAQVAAEMGLSTSLVHKRLKEAGISKKGTPGRKGAPVDIEEAKRMYAEGKSLLDIAVAFKTVVPRIRRFLEDEGVEIRRPGECQRVKPSIANKERLELIRARREAGKTLEEIGAELHITRERVRQLCIKGGISPEPHLTPEQRQAVEEYASGGSLVFVAEQHKTHPNTLRNWILRAGYEIRPAVKKRRVKNATLEKAKIAGRMYRQGATIKEIADRLTGGTAGGAVYKLLAYEGILPNRRPTEYLHNTVAEKTDA